MRKVVIPESVVGRLACGMPQKSAVKTTAHRPKNRALLSRVNTCLVIRDKHLLEKIPLRDILFIESNHVYVNIYTRTRKLLVRASIRNCLSLLDTDYFFRVHRGYLVNIHLVEHACSHYVTIGDFRIPVSKYVSKALRLLFKELTDSRLLYGHRSEY